MINSEAKNEVNHTISLFFRNKTVKNIIVLTVYLFAFMLIFIFGVYNIIIHNDIFYLHYFYIPIINIQYFGYVGSFIIAGFFIIILNNKFKLYSIPLFIVSYTSWDVFEQGTYNIIHSTETFFIILIYMSIIFALIIFKNLKIKSSPWYLVPLICSNALISVFPLIMVEYITQVCWYYFIYKSVNNK